MLLFVTLNGETPCWAASASRFCAASCLVRFMWATALPCLSRSTGEICFGFGLAAWSLVFCDVLLAGFAPDGGDLAGCAPAGTANAVVIRHAAATITPIFPPDVRGFGARLSANRMLLPPCPVRCLNTQREI